MMTELERVLTVIREALADLAHPISDQIAEKLKKAGMLWCGPGEREQSCPLHHYLESRLIAHGLEGISLSVSPNDVSVIIPTPDGLNSLILQPFPQSISQFVYRYDRGDYRHLEGQA